MIDAKPSGAVILLSADAEWNAIRKSFPRAEIISYPYGSFFKTALDRREVMFIQGGWGKISAAASAQFAIDHFHPKLIVNLGTCGGFSGSVECGQTILVNETVVYDIIEQMSDPDDAIHFYSTKMDLTWLKRPFPQPVILGRLVSGDRDIVSADIPMLKSKYHAIAADWESGSIAWVSQHNQVPSLILRTVSDIVDESGSEFYTNGAGFSERAHEIMENLLKFLPAWLDCCSDCLSLE